MAIFCVRGLLIISMVTVLATATSGKDRSDQAPSIIFPPALRPGDTIRFVAPAGPANRERLEEAARKFRTMGFKVQIPANLYREDDYLAGTDQERADELMAAFRDSEIDAVMPARGGYGAMRILDRLDYEVIRDHPKILTGFSDITALHLAIQKKTGLVTFHSPNPEWGLGNAEGMSPLAAHWYWRALLADRYNVDAPPGYLLSATWPGATPDEYPTTCELPPPSALHGGKARGRLTGGNLSLVAALSGTPYEMETAGRILFLEDIGEAPYRVDRMLCTLKLAGKLDGLAGVILGTFTRREEEDTTGEVRTIPQVLKEYFAPLGIPVMIDFPIGHHVCNATFPMGVLCELDADKFELRLLENPVTLLP